MMKWLLWLKRMSLEEVVSSRLIMLRYGHLELQIWKKKVMVMKQKKIINNRLQVHHWNQEKVEREPVTMI